MIAVLSRRDFEVNRGIKVLNYVRIKIQSSIPNRGLCFCNDSPNKRSNIQVNSREHVENRVAEVIQGLFCDTVVTSLEALPLALLLYLCAMCNRYHDDHIKPNLHTTCSKIGS